MPRADDFDNFEEGLPIGGQESNEDIDSLTEDDLPGPESLARQPSATGDEEALPFEQDIEGLHFGRGIAADEEEEDHSAYSKKVQERINKEVGRRHASDRRAEAAEKEAARLRAENDELRGSYMKNATAELERQKGELSKERMRLMNDVTGDPEENQRKLEEVEDKLAEVRADLVDIKRSAQRQPQPKQQPTGQTQQNGDGSAAAKWLERNGAWYDQNSPKHNPKAAQLADSIFYELTDEGKYPQDSPAFFKELNARLSRQFKPEGQGNTLGGARGNEGGNKGQRGGLGKEDFDLMRETGLDPGKLEDRKTYLRRIGGRSI